METDAGYPHPDPPPERERENKGAGREPSTLLLPGQGGDREGGGPDAPPLPDESLVATMASETGGGIRPGAIAPSGGETGMRETIEATAASIREMAAREAKNRFGQLLDAAQSAPVRVTRNGRPVGVMMSTSQYERLRGAAWERLSATMDSLGEEASANGLTEAGLEALLADES